MQREYGGDLRFRCVGADQQWDTGPIQFARQFLELGGLPAAVFQRTALRTAGKSNGTTHPSAATPTSFRRTTTWSELILLPVASKVNTRPPDDATWSPNR